MSQINFEVIDQFFAAQIAANESEATLESLRPQVEVAVKEMMRSDLKDLRADMKRTGEKLAKDHPDSESIKVGFRLAIKQ